MGHTKSIRSVTAVVNVADLSPPDAKFVDIPGVQMLEFSGLSQNALERLITKPKISRYRAAFQAVRAAKGMPIISHLPRMTAAVSMVQAISSKRSPHLAFAFNFTDLPKGWSRRYMVDAFSRVDEFFVFSEYERELYPRYFSLPQERFTSVIWTQDPPRLSGDPSPFVPNSYVSAVGGEGRDYETLLAAAGTLPEINFVIIARPYTVMGPLPPNVRLLANVPAELTWRIALESSCLIVPLKTRETCCGHITIVSGQLLGIPIISTVSEATREYTKDVTLCEPGDVAQLASLIHRHHEQATEFREAAMERIPAKRTMHDRKRWNKAISSALNRYF